MLKRKDNEISVEISYSQANVLTEDEKMLYKLALDKDEKGKVKTNDKGEMILKLVSLSPHTIKTNVTRRVAAIGRTEDEKTIQAFVTKYKKHIKHYFHLMRNLLDRNMDILWICDDKVGGDIAAREVQKVLGHVKDSNTAFTIMNYAFARGYMAPLNLVRSNIIEVVRKKLIDQIPNISGKTKEKYMCCVLGIE